MFLSFSKNSYLFECRSQYKAVFLKLPSVKELSKELFISRGTDGSFFKFQKKFDAFILLHSFKHKRDKQTVYKNYFNSILPERNRVLCHVTRDNSTANCSICTAVINSRGQELHMQALHLTTTTHVSIGYCFILELNRTQEVHFSNLDMQNSTLT
jgi:hypothetical protein